MSKAGKILFLFSFLSFVALLVARLVMGGWHDGLWAPMAISVICLVLGVLRDRQTILEFLTMRTTKHGMNMGVLIVVAVIGLACVNFLAVRYEKKFDWTSDKLHTLSDHSVKAAQALKQDVEILLLYRRDQQNENIQKSVSDLIAMYSNVSKNVKFSAYNVLQRPDLAQQYEVHGGPFTVFAVQGSKKVRIDQPTEEEVTKALLKIGRETKKVIYFTMGHGERAIEDRQPEGLATLKDELSAIYEVKPLALFQVENKVPADAEAVAVIGPRQEFLEVEIAALRNYARRGGRLILALDPGMKHNLARLTKSLGVEFANNYVLDRRSESIGASAAVALGTMFSKSSEITKAFDLSRFTIFNLTSHLRKDPSAGAGLQYEEIVRTYEGTIAIDDLKPKAATVAPSGPHTLAVTVSGMMAGSEKDIAEDKGSTDTKEEPAKEFTAIVFGDSDFMSNALFDKNLNRDLTLNSVASLMKDQELISIRPKAPKGTKLELPGDQFVFLILGAWLPVPLLMFIAGGVVWWRRRTA